MCRIMITSNPDVNNQGFKRWFIGDVVDGRLMKLFLFESTPEARRATQCRQFALRFFSPTGSFIKEQFFDRHYNLVKHLCRLFDVDQVDLGQRYTYAEAPDDKNTLLLYDNSST